MTYRSTQIYDFRKLDRMLDYDKLFDNAIESLSELHDRTHIDIHADHKEVQGVQGEIYQEAH